MKKIFYVLNVAFLLLLVSCTKEDLNEDIKAIEKDKIETPGGQSSLGSEDDIQSRIDKDKVETPGGR